MASPEVRIEASRPAQDTTMGGDDSEVVAEALETLEGVGDEGEGGEKAEGEEEEEAAPQMSFIDYLKSPVVEIAIGSEAPPTVLRAHQALLQRSPFFATAIAAFSPDAAARRIEFPAEDEAAVGAFLQYLYTGEYFPRRVGDGLESVPAGARTGERAAAAGEGAEAEPGETAAGGDDADDDSGEGLLRHARVYTLAEKLGLGELKALAHAKVHRVSSTAKGEIAYARYVYARTPRDDATIRRPIAAFWGQRSHVLRHQAEREFRALCLDFPDFGFDVLNWALDAREKRREEREKGADKAPDETPGRPGRKRQRQI